MDRRHVVSGGLVAAVAAAAGPVPAAADQRDDQRVDERTAAAIDALRAVIERSVAVSPELARIREQQRVFLKANHKFPDFIEVGIGVWESVYDWHVRHQRPIEIRRTADGRYIIEVMDTTLVLRPEQAETYVGFGFDMR